MLILNAAIMANPLTRDARGYESQFATNHLGHFQLAARLWPLVAAAGAGARVVALSSLAHKRSAFHPEDPNYETPRIPQVGSLWSGQDLQRAVRAAARQARSASSEGHPRPFAVHPGGIMTNLGRYLVQEEDIAMFAASDVRQACKFKTVEQGAATTVWAATSPALAGTRAAFIARIATSQQPTGGGIEQRFGGVMAHACDRRRCREIVGIFRKP